MPTVGTAATEPATGSGPPGRRGPHRRGRSRPAAVLAVVLTVTLILLSLFTGGYDLSQDYGVEMFWITRVPRTVALILAGAAMATCGLVMQLLTQNRFVEPTTTGTTEWAGLGLLAVMILLPQSSLSVRMAGAIVASFIGTMIFFLFLRRVSLKSSLMVPLVGIMLGAVVGAFSTYLALTTNMLQQLGIWFSGSFTDVVRGNYELLWIVLAVTAGVFIVADRFTAAGLGKEISTNLGLHYNRVVLLGVGMVSIATGVVTVVIGALPFLGLIVPNLVSMFRGDNLRTNLPWVCMVGVWVIMVCDLLGRTLIAPFELPVSVILGVGGAVVFIVLISSRRRLA